MLHSLITRKLPLPSRRGETIVLPPAIEEPCDDSVQRACDEAKSPLGHEQMITRSAVCQQREAHHREIAATAQLPNVRKIALAAADAWHEQALEADQHEHPRRPTLSKEDAGIALEFLSEDDDRNVGSSDARFIGRDRTITAISMQDQKTA